jgi:hypothetical protein
MEIADKCPVHRTLTSEINIRTTRRLKVDRARINLRVLQERKPGGRAIARRLRR